MTLIELLKKAEHDPLFAALLGKGAIPLSLLDHKVIYEFYQQRRQEAPSELIKVAIMETMIEFGISRKTVFLIIKRMES